MMSSQLHSHEEIYQTIGIKLNTIDADLIMRTMDHAIRDG